MAENIIKLKPKEEIIRIKFTNKPNKSPQAPKIWRKEINFLNFENPQRSYSFIILFEKKEFRP